jgi:hypothetical protein
MIPIIFFSLPHLFLVAVIMRGIDVTPRVLPTVDGMA